jgi:dihydroorotate dehydrogenase electron transfer subunit
MSPQGIFSASATVHPFVTPITKIKQETPRTKSFILSVPTIAPKAYPGQFLMVWIPGSDEIPMSIARIHGSQIEFAAAKVGEATTCLHALQVGDLLGLRGPLGKGFQFPSHAKSKRLLLVAGGCGAPPILFAATHAIKKGYNLDIILGATSKAELLFHDEFKKLRPDNFLIATDDGTAGHHGTSVDLLKIHLKENRKYAASFACGPEGMLVNLYEALKSQPIPLQVSLERYMKCGVGICGHCIIDTQGRRVCHEGPVFDAKTLENTDFGRWTRDGSGKRQGSVGVTSCPQ